MKLKPISMSSDSSVSITVGGSPPLRAHRVNLHPPSPALSLSQRPITDKNGSNDVPPGSIRTSHWCHEVQHLLSELLRVWTRRNRVDVQVCANAQCVGVSCRCVAPHAVAPALCAELALCSQFVPHVEEAPRLVPATLL